MHESVRIPRRPVAVLLAMLLVLAFAPAALGQASPRLSAAVTDLVGAVTGSEAEIESALNELREQAQAQLFVLYTDTTDGTDVVDFTSQVASDNGLGVGDALYAIATEDRTYSLWISDSLTDRISLEAQDRILLEAEDRLVDGDLAGAAVVVADELREALTGGGLPVLPILVLLVLAGAVAGVWYLYTRRRASAGQAQRLEGLATEASGLLLEVDEQVRNATQEVGYVEAMYGPSEVAPYSGAIEQARATLAEAFEIQQRLDDAEAEDAATREAMLRQVSELARTAQAVLLEQQTRIRELRDLERDAPALLSSLEVRLDALQARLPEADRAMAAMEESHVASDWETVRGDREEAAKRITAARDSIAEGLSALAGKDTSEAALEVREATQAVAEAATLLDAIEAAARELAAARARLDIELQEAATDIATARDRVAAEPSAEREARLAEATSLLDEARRLAAADPVDVLGALRQADTAEAIADELIADAREEDEARRRQAAALESAITTARAKVEMAAGYVATRRHGVGSTARVRSTEAERHLRAAIDLASTDPQAALAEARRAEQLADEAQRDAARDFDGWDQRPASSSQPAGPDLGGVILGAVLGGLFSAGGGSGPGWGGTSWGGSGGAGRSRPPAARFPGSGGGMGRGGGGRSSGGGGRARGGRW